MWYIIKIMLWNSKNTNINYYDLGLVEAYSHQQKKIKYSQETTIFSIVRPTSCLYISTVNTYQNIHYISIIWTTTILIDTHKSYQHNKLTNPKHNTLKTKNSRSSNYSEYLINLSSSIVISLLHIYKNFMMFK